MHDATLAFTTSLEELLTQLAKADHIPEPVINALWTIFGTREPAGLIIILGCLFVIWSLVKS